MFRVDLERMSVHQYDCTLHQSLGTDQLVVGGIVGNIQHTNLTSAYFGSPREITRIQTKCTVFQVSTSSANFVDALLTNTSIGSGTP